MSLTEEINNIAFSYNENKPLLKDLNAFHYSQSK